MSCNKCPRKCKNLPGFCNSDSAKPEIAAVYAHRGEEPPLSGNKGISNIFFAHCNLQCCFCQNYSISRPSVDPELTQRLSVAKIIDAVEQSLQKTENIVGLVSATQYSDLVAPIVEGLHAKGLYPTIVYNTNGYESIEVLEQIAPYIDIYLPDYKYSIPDLSRRYSNAADYPEVAQKALIEMYNQKGSSLPTDDNGMAFRGLIIRHLVLPGCVENSIKCLEWIANNLSSNVHISLMAQYFPPDGLSLPDELGRKLNEDEYNKVVDTFYSLGFHRGWVQELDSAENYHPHFASSTTTFK